MKIEIDKNNLLTIFNENIPQTKEYTYNVGGYLFSDFDKGMIVLHKKDIKIVNLKNLWDGMSVVYYKEASTKPIIRNNDAIGQVFWLFSSFNETSGKTYFFVPNVNDKEIVEKNQILEKLNIEYRLQKTETGVITDGIPFTETDQRISLLFGLILLYGKFDAKKGELNSVKIHLPLFGQYMKYAETLDAMINKMRWHWYFVKADKLMNNNGMTYQISTNDYELLEIFAKWYEPVEKFEKISKVIFTQEMKSKLLEFLENNSEIPEEGKTEVINKIKNGTIKFLMK